MEDKETTIGYAVFTPDTKVEKAHRERRENTRRVQELAREHQAKRAELAELDTKRVELNAEVKGIGKEIHGLNNRNETLNTFIALAEEI